VSVASVLPGRWCIPLVEHSHTLHRYDPVQPLAEKFAATVHHYINQDPVLTPGGTPVVQVLERERPGGGDSHHAAQYFGIVTDDEFDSR
jgi:hypothetical protein